MKYILLPLFFLVFIFPHILKAQVENVIVETYYISDTTDAKDTDGGYLPAGSTTYRVYIDMKPGSKLLKIYGDVNHTLKIKSDSVFFNNVVDGQTFAKDIKASRYGENTVALDTWLTLGQATKTGPKTYFGVLKSEDQDGSFVGGANNDGGSAGVPLITNTDPRAGVPVTTTDGMATMTSLPSNWGDIGIKNFAGDDSTIFGSVVQGNQFVSNFAFLQCSGATGVNPDSNKVLIAQLTTRGNISFELNIEIEQPASPNPKVVKYVAKLADGDSLLPDVVLCPYLKYPPSCGCKDRNYLEYSETFACSSIDSCKTRRVYGCTDPTACNFDPSANILLPNFCCYPGSCQDRDLSLACLPLKIEKHGLYPNPAKDQFAFTVSANYADVKYEIYNFLGIKVMEENMGVVAGTTTGYVNVSGLPGGMYLFRLYSGQTSSVQFFMKN